MSEDRPEPPLTLTRYVDALAHRSIVWDVAPETMMSRLGIDDWSLVNARWSVRLLTGTERERARATRNFHTAIERIQEARAARVRLPPKANDKD